MVEFGNGQVKKNNFKKRNQQKTHHFPLAPHGTELDVDPKDETSTQGARSRVGPTGELGLSTGRRKRVTITLEKEVCSSQPEEMGAYR